MFSIDQVLEKLKAGEPVQLCDIYSAVSLEGKAGEEKRRAALTAWLAKTDTPQGLDAVVAELVSIKANTLGTFNILDLVEAHSRLQVETLGMPSVSRQLAVTTASNGVQLTASCRRISLVAVGCDMRFRVGSTSVNAQTTDHLIQRGERIDIHVNAQSWINVIRDAAATTNGTLNITELTA